MFRNGTLVLLASIAPISFYGCDQSGGNNRALVLSDSVPASTYGSDLARSWMDLSYQLVKTLPGYSPPVASRAYGYAGVTLYEALAHGTPGRRSLVGQLNELIDLPLPPNSIHHWPTVANRALALVLTELFPAGAADIANLEDGYLLQFRDEVDEEVMERSIDYGDRLAEGIIAWAANDGFASVASCNGAFQPPTVNGPWVGNGAGVQPCWGLLRTFVVMDALECTASTPPPFSSATNSEFYAHSLLVYNLTGDDGAHLTADQAAIAHYWGDGPGVTGTPPGHWIAIVGVVASDERLTLDDAAEAYARVGLAVADAFITCWETKYSTYLLRPNTYIQTYIDPDWTPLLPTPNFPTYTSGHSTQSGAAAIVLTSMFGPLAFLDTTHTEQNPELGFSDRSFRSFLEAADEAATSRLYGGIHYVFDSEEGLDQGYCVGSIIDERVRFWE